jgi:hypothetical protein
MVIDYACINLYGVGDLFVLFALKICLDLDGCRNSTENYLAVAIRWPSGK